MQQAIEMCVSFKVFSMRLISKFVIVYSHQESPSLHPVSNYDIFTTIYGNIQ